MDRYYYIGDSTTTNPQDLGKGVRISCISNNHPLFSSPDLEGPFASIEELRKNSKIFKDLAKTNPSRIQKILMNRNILKVKDFIITDSGLEVPISFIKIFEHIVRGDIYKKKIEGVHFFDKKSMKVTSLKRKSDFRGVWMADIQVYDKIKKEWFTKPSTTLFPINWSLTSLFNECYFAVKHMRKIPNTESKFSSYTYNGIPVEIILKDEDFITIYPIVSI